MYDGSLEEAVQSGDRRRALLALRDYLAHELEGNRCSKCAMSQLRTGDTATLVLRLTKVMEEIEAMPEHSGEVSDLDAIRARRNGTSAAPPSAPSGLGTKHGPRRQGGRAASGTRKPGA
ncbi:hypothetical protein [Streptomyces nigrescens]